MGLERREGVEVEMADLPTLPPLALLHCCSGLLPRPHHSPGHPKKGNRIVPCILENECIRNEVLMVFSKQHLKRKQEVCWVKEVWQEMV